MDAVVKVKLQNTLSPGDILIMSATIHSLHTQFPGKYQTDVSSPCNDIYRNNPHVTRLADAISIPMHYPNIHRSNQTPVRYIDGYCEYLAEQLKIPLRLTTNKPHIYLTEQELSRPKVTGDYVVICSGFKKDFTVKNYGIENWQKVVDWIIKEKGWKVVQIGENHPNHVHHPLNGAISLVGKTNIRELFALSYGAKLGLGHESFLHHIFASHFHVSRKERVSIPFVCIASGWNNKGYASYNSEQYLSRQGCLSCCKDGGCFKGKVDKDCLFPIIKDVDAIGKCMDMISPDEVINAIENYKYII